MEKICVAVRVRPSTTIEDKINGTFWKVEDNRISLHRPIGTPVSEVAAYAFDHVFDQTSTNSRVYDLLTKDVILAAVEGFNGTVFAYGQTSSGKTFTMNGSDNNPGVIHRAVEDIFDLIHKNNQREFLIRVSYMEIYNEDINDLLVVENQKLQIHESLDCGVFVAGLREEIVSNSEQVLKLLEAGEANRHFGETNMNARSSRSHTIFKMVIESKSKEMNASGEYLSSDAIRVSVLNLVDLAGSERIAKTGADGVRLKEGKHINKSLMVLGNVINKLSEGAKQRGHIPYRDSKLTRILQSALGGNAKTSIICTVAPEEVHIEETRGTLQFATRAKRITNCAQVNEILTDAALLKRQKLEIEELRQKLQGSRSEVLEQEILKLRNDMLKYELEREKLAMELEEERKRYRQRDQCIKEQQMQIDNLSNIVKSSDSDRNKANDFVRQGITFERTSGQNMFPEDAFSTPCFKAAPKSFVVKRSNYPVASDSSCSPFPDSFTNVADEDEWMKLNNGYVADLDSLHMTPAVKVRSFSSGGASPALPTHNYEEEIENLKKQLKLATKDKDELKIRHVEEVTLLKAQMDELQKQAQQIHKISEVLSESVATCRDIYKDVLSVVLSSVADEKSFAAQLLSSTCEIGTNLFSTLESHITTNVDGHKALAADSSLLQEQCKTLYERLNSTVAMLAASEAQSAEVTRDVTIPCDYKGFKFRDETSSWKEKLGVDLNTIRDQYISLEEGQHLKLSEEKNKESAQKLALLLDQKKKILKEYDTEVQRRKDLEEGIKGFSIAFTSRHKLLASYHSQLRYKVESLRGHESISVHKC